MGCEYFMTEVNFQIAPTIAPVNATVDSATTSPLKLITVQNTLRSNAF
jgi:hypothetical protein